MNPMPPAAVAIFAAALDDYRAHTPTDGAARLAARYLLDSGYAVTPAPGARRSRRRKTTA